MPKDTNIIHVYTDGSARGNPGPAGWAAIFLYKGKVFEMGGGSEHATNNQMELTGPIEALKYLHKNKIKLEVEFFSDSKYVILGITEWILGWKKNGWRNAAKKQVLNRELWEELDALVAAYKPKWNYVKGHNENEWNERADEIATSFADKTVTKLRQDKIF